MIRAKKNTSERGVEHENHRCQMIAADNSILTNMKSKKFVKKCSLEWFIIW